MSRRAAQNEERVAELNRQMVELYGQALERADASWGILARSSTPKREAKIFRQSSSRTLAPLSATSAGFTSVQPSPGARTDQARPRDQSMTAGRASQSTKTIGGSPTDEDIGAAGATRKAVGDPSLAAEAERALEEAGGDFDIFVIDETTGEPVERSARAALRQRRREGTPSMSRRAAQNEERVAELKR
jgi:hypothetical protein